MRSKQTNRDNKNFVKVLKSCKVSYKMLNSDLSMRKNSALYIVNS